jgi:integrase
MAKRHNGEGSVRQRPNGRWEARLAFTDPITGDSTRESFYGATAKEARAMLKTARERLDAGQPARDSDLTIAQWTERWVTTSLEASSRRESTKQLSRTLLRKHVDPTRLGTIALDRLRPSHIDAWVLELRGRMKTTVKEDGSVSLTRALSDSTIQRTFQVLRSCLSDAVRDGLLARNTAELVRQPSATRSEARHLSPAEVAAVLDAARSTRHWAIFALIAGTGLRKGEALALRWDNVDFAAGTITVRGTLQRLGGRLVVSEPKTAKSRRVLAPSERVMEILRAQRKSQVAERLAAANVWHETGHVFTTESGLPMDPRNVLRAFKAAGSAAGLADATVHTLRHSAATAMLDAGVHLKAVSELLGHSGTQITADTYAHLTTGTARRAMDSLGEALGV